MLGGQTGVTEPTTPAPQVVPRIVAVCNQKGGVAKTTTCVNLAAGLAAAGMRVLVVDLDAQANASRSLGVTQAMRGAYEFLAGDDDKASAAVRSAVTGVMVVPATPALHLSELEPAVAAMSAAELRARLTAPDVAIDIILIDCPPTLGVLSINAISAADLILIPVTPTTYGIDALHKTTKTITELGGLHADCVAVLLTIFDADDPRAVEAAETIRRRYSDFLLPMSVPKDAGHAEAASRNRPLLALNPEAPAATAYWRLTVAILRLLQPFSAPAVALPAPPPPPPPPPPPLVEPVLVAAERVLPPAPPQTRSARNWVAVLAAGLLGLMAGGALVVGAERLLGVSLADRVPGLVTHSLPVEKGSIAEPWREQMDEIQK